MFVDVGFRPMGVPLSPVQVGSILQKLSPRLVRISIRKFKDYLKNNYNCYLPSVYFMLCNKQNSKHKFIPHKTLSLSISSLR